VKSLARVKCLHDSFGVPKLPLAPHSTPTKFLGLNLNPSYSSLNLSNPPKTSLYLSYSLLNLFIPPYMDSKVLIIQLIKENKRYWGQLLYQEYFDLFQKVRSNALLAELITKDLGHTISEKQIDNLKKRLHSTVLPKIQTPSIPAKTTNTEQELYNQIYGQTNKSQFDLENM
jgi:hypothetical protein